MSRHGPALLLAACGWTLGLAWRATEQPVGAATVAGYVRAAAYGPEGWRCAACWGSRGTYLGAAREDRQRILDACGPAALAVLLRERQPGVTQELLWSMCRLPGGGTTLGRLAWAAQRFGVACHVCSTQDPAALPSPALVHLRRGHFVVLQRCDARHAWILDPACGIVRVPRPVLARRTSGAALVFAPAGRCTATLHPAEDS